ncbi:hypothetical protein [Planobispora rosea]|uniref:hypothetical protein n=1 Tax=Planobispora rosea TaxID=35762 RepID=UPI00083A87EA|nr:hypothetical protein [Planobispora rosea]
MTARPSLVIATAADLEVGDSVARDGVDFVITRLIPPTREEALAYGEREIRSGGVWWTLLAEEPVDATPGPNRAAVTRG